MLFCLIVMTGFLQDSKCFSSRTFSSSDRLRVLLTTLWILNEGKERFVLRLSALEAALYLITFWLKWIAHPATRNGRNRFTCRCFVTWLTPLSLGCFWLDPKHRFHLCIQVIGHQHIFLFGRVHLVFYLSFEHVVVSFKLQNRTTFVLMRLQIYYLRQQTYKDSLIVDI